MTKATAKVAAVVMGLAVAASMLSLAPLAQAQGLTSSQVQSILSLLSSFGANSATIANVNSALTGAPSTGGTTTTTTTTGCSFTKDLTVGSTGTEVTCLQNALIAGGYNIAAGATGSFGPQTLAAVIAWQKAKGISPAAGYFGAKSRAAFGGTTTGTTGGTTTPPTAGTGNGLKISLSATSPNGTVLVATQGIGDLADFVFANPTAAPINVTALSFKRIGSSNDSTLSNIYLYNGGIRLTDSAGISSSAFSFSDPVALFTVPAGGTYTVSVRSDIVTGSAGQQVGVQLVSATSSGTLDSSVALPISGGYQSISGATLASVNYSSSLTPSATSISPQSNFPIWQDTITVSTNPVKLNSIRFTNLGSIDSSYVTNLQLYVDGVAVGSAVPSMAGNRYVTFDLSANPVVFSTQGHVVKVLATITGGSSRTLQMSVQRSSDAMFVDSQLGQPVTPLYNSTTFSAATAGIITISSVTASSGVSVSLAPNSPTSAVPVGASSVKWASFTMLASGENVKVSDLYVFASSTLSTGAIDGVGGLANGKVFLNGIQVGSTKALNQYAAAGVYGSATDFSLGSSLILPAGQTVTVDIYADAKVSSGSANLVTGDSVVISLAAGSSNAQGQSSLTATNVPATITSSNAITVSSSSLTANKYSGYGNQIMIAGAIGAKIGAFTLSTGSTEGVTVNTIAFSLVSGNAASITNLILKDEATGTQIGTTVSTPNDTSNSFAVSFDIPASSTKTIGIYANILAGANIGPIKATITVATAGTGDLTGSSATAASTVLQTITVGSGTLTVAKGAGDPVSTNVIAGANSVLAGEFNFAAQNSQYTVQNLAILVPNSAATSVTAVTVSYKDINGAPQTQTQPLAVNSSTAAPYATATFTGLTMNVPANDSANLDVYLGIPTIASGATSGAGINIALDEGSTTATADTSFKAINSAGTALTYAQGSLTSTVTSLASGGTLYVRKSLPTFATLSGQGGAIVPTNPIYRFSVTADPAGAIEWTKVTFTYATSSTSLNVGMLTNPYIVDEATGASLLDSNTLSATSTVTTAGVGKIIVDLAQNSTYAKYAQVAANTTKIYDLNATISGFTTGSSLSIALAQDTSATTTATAAQQSAVPAAIAAGTSSSLATWSDRSYAAHSVTTPDWTNGYLLKNFTTTTVTYSK